MDLSFLIDWEPACMSWPVDDEASDQVTQLGSERWPCRKLVLAYARRLQAPTMLDRRTVASGRLSHDGRCPVGGLAGCALLRGGSDTIDQVHYERRDAGWPRLFPQQAYDALPPAPRRLLRHARFPPDRALAVPVSAQEHDPCSPNLYPKCFPLPNECSQLRCTVGGDANDVASALYPYRLAVSSHGPITIVTRILPSNTRCQ